MWEQRGSFFLNIKNKQKSENEHTKLNLTGFDITDCHCAKLIKSYFTVIIEMPRIR